MHIVNQGLQKGLYLEILDKSLQKSDKMLSLAYVSWYCFTEEVVW